MIWFRTDGLTDQPTDRHTYGVACIQLTRSYKRQHQSQAGPALWLKISKKKSILTKLTCTIFSRIQSHDDVEVNHDHDNDHDNDHVRPKIHQTQIHFARICLSLIGSPHRRSFKHMVELKKLRDQQVATPNHMICVIYYEDVNDHVIIWWYQWLCQTIWFAWFTTRMYMTMLLSDDTSG